MHEWILCGRNLEPGTTHTHTHSHRARHKAKSKQLKRSIQPRGRRSHTRSCRLLGTLKAKRGRGSRRSSLLAAARSGCFGVVQVYLSRAYEDGALRSTVRVAIRRAEEESRGPDASNSKGGERGGRRDVCGGRRGQLEVLSRSPSVSSHIYLLLTTAIASNCIRSELLPARGQYRVLEFQVRQWPSARGNRCMGGNSGAAALHVS